MDGNKPVGRSSFCVGWMIGMLIYNNSLFPFKKECNCKHYIPRERYSTGVCKFPPLLSCDQEVVQFSCQLGYVLGIGFSEDACRCTVHWPPSIGKACMPNLLRGAIIHQYPSWKNQHCT